MLLSENEISEKLKSIENWEKQGKEITRTFKFKNFIESIGFVNRIAILAEKADHHPDILIQYNRVRINLSTHSDGGITDKDFKLAGQIEGLSG